MRSDFQACTQISKAVVGSIYIVKPSFPPFEIGFQYDARMKVVLFGNCVELGLVVSLLWVRTSVVLRMLMQASSAASALQRSWHSRILLSL